MANFQFSLSSKKVLKGLTDKVKKKVIKAQENAIDTLRDKFGTEFLRGGFSAYDYYRKYYYGKNADTTKHHYNNWTFRTRVSSQGVSTEIRNRRKYTSYLYKDGFISSEHTGKMYWTKDRKHVTYHKAKTYNQIRAIRKQQIRKTDYLSIQAKIKGILTKEIRKVVPIAPSATTTYKG